jgi:hypothetical protein
MWQYSEAMRICVHPIDFLAPFQTLRRYHKLAAWQIFARPFASFRLNAAAGLVPFT